MCYLIVLFDYIRSNSSIEIDVRMSKFGNTSGFLYIYDGSSIYDPLIAVIRLVIIFLLIKIILLHRNINEIYSLSF